MPRVGARVVVPLGTRVVTGIVVETGVRASAERRAASDERQADPRRCSTPDAFVPPDVVALARWTAEYYAAGVGDTIPALLPPMARGGRADAHKTPRMAAITAAGLGGARPGDRAADAEAARGARAARRHADRHRHRRRSPRAGIAADAVSRLAKRGYVSLRQDRVDRDPFDGGQTRVRRRV